MKTTENLRSILERYVEAKLSGSGTQAFEEWEKLEAEMGKMDNIGKTCHKLAAVLIPVRLGPIESLTSDEWLALADKAIGDYSKLPGAVSPLDEGLFSRGEKLYKEICCKTEKDTQS